jgi:hypothetical protein
MPHSVPFIHAKGKKCSSHVAGIRAFEADLEWSLAQMAFWRFDCGAPQSHYHLGCAEKEQPCGSWANDAEQLKLYYVKLPETLQKVIAQKYGPG